VSKSLYLVVGLLFVALIFWDAFEVMLLPLPIRRNLRLVMLFVRYTWHLWSTIARRLRPGERRERLLGVYGPLSLVILICLWVSGLVFGFGLIQHALRRDSFRQDLYFSGITFFTVGYGDLVPRSMAMKAIAVVEAGCGLGFLALVIGYLPVLYQLFARREAHVMLLDERAGSPPTATTLLKRHADGHALDLLEQLLREWERWASELLESHISYPMLGFYRSQFSNQSWLAALASMMDVCSLLMVGVEGMRTFQARMTFSAARLAIVELARVLGVKEVAVGDSRLTAIEFGRMRETLKESGLEIVEADAELQLARFRATYEPFLGSLAQYLMAPLPKWISSEEQLDNWENNKRGATAKKLVEAATPEPGA
jgi:Ion channel